jgi:SAM-dependent methyltransferase
VTAGKLDSGASPEAREARRVVQRIARPKIWQYDYLMLREIVSGLRRQAAALNGRGNLEILDVGCKYQPYRELFQERAARYVGVDLRSFPGVGVRGDALALPFRDDTFDLVVCTQAFYLMTDFRRALSELARVTRSGGRILLTTIGIWPYPPAVKLHRWSRRELEEALADFGEARVEESGGLLQLVPQLANALLAMGVEGPLVGRHPRAGRLLALPLKGLYVSVNVLGMATQRLIRGASRAGLGMARSMEEVDAHLAINYLAVVRPRK